VNTVQNEVTPGQPRSQTRPLLADVGGRRGGQPQDGSRSDEGELIKAIGTEYRVNLGRIYTETERYLSNLSRAVAEGRAVDEANNFLRWLQFSGVLRLLEQNCFINEKFLKLRPQADELQNLCKPFLQGRNIKENPSQSRIDEINDKVDAILSAIAKNVSPPFVDQKRVLEIGGAK
jgi:hypothetical protein